MAKIVLKKGNTKVLSYIKDRGMSMNKLSTEEINEIRASVNIVDIISSYMPLTKRGKNYFGVCPFHDDRDPSLSVSEEKQIYKCFSCGESGNVFNFVMEYDNVSFYESLQKIAASGGVKLNIQTFTPTYNKNTKLYEIYNVSQMFYQNNINTEYGGQARTYLSRRQIDDDIIKEFGIGLSLKENDILTNLLIQKGFTLDELIKSGIVMTGDYGNKDIFYNRIMFPLTDPSGQIVGYSGRAYDTNDGPKYINTKETEIFKKGKLLYNYHRARESSRLSKSVIIVEGFMDVIKLHANGIKNVVATMGTAVTKDQALLIKKLAPEVIVCFDGDDAGARATLSIIDELASVGVTPKVVRLEDNMDPDDYINKHGTDNFKMLLENPINVMDFKISYFKHDQNLTDHEEMAKYINKLIDELVKVDDDILRELSLKKISEEAKLDIDLLRNKLNEMRHNIIKPVVEVLEKKAPSLVNKYINAEQNLLYYMLKSREVIVIYNKKITFMPTDRYRYLAQEISYFYNTNKYFNLADFFSSIAEEKEIIQTVNEIENLDLKEEYTIEEIDDYINVIREYHVNYEQNRLMNKLKQETDLMKKAKIAEEIMKLKEGV